MDEELLELQKQFEIAQEAKSSIRLSERNVVELVQKLHDLHIIQFDLLHTVSGKEFITPVHVAAGAGDVGAPHVWRRDKSSGRAGETEGAMVAKSDGGQILRYSCAVVLHSSYLLSSHNESMWLRVQRRWVHCPFGGVGEVKEQE